MPILNMNRYFASLQTERVFAFLLFVLSGFTGLLYEVLWLKELGLLFGSGAHATATTLAVFFLGIAAGSYVWGTYAPRFTNCLVAYGILEIVVGITGLLYFKLLDFYHWIYEPLYELTDGSLPWLIAAKFVLALGILFPAAFAMGGTFPLMGQYLIRHDRSLGKTGTLLYALNTLGAAAGAFMAGFYMPIAFGFTTSYTLAIGLSVGIGVTACWVGRSGYTDHKSLNRRPATRRKNNTHGRDVNTTVVWMVAFASGFLALGLQVAWTQMFAQVLQNSVYTFSIVLLVFLLALAVGAFLARGLCRLRVRPRIILTCLLTLSGLWVAATSFLFMWVTEGLTYVGSIAAGWNNYLVSIFVSTTVVLLLPGLLVGSVFPYVLRVAESWRMTAGPTLGRLTAVNMIGAILGSLVVGFFLLSSVGLWETIRLFGIAYLVLAVMAVDPASRFKSVFRLLPIVGILFLVLVLNSGQMPSVRLNPERNERVISVSEDSYGVVAVVERDNGRLIKVNNYYSLGGTAAREHEQNQALIPLMGHPSPESVFILGLGTGITAGAALRLPIERLVVCELLPGVVRAAAAHFRESSNGLFTDPRVEIVVGDGRNQLLGSAERYDVIIADLFIPWRADVGNLYTREHFEAARNRLKSGGHFVQWLPLYQLSSEEFFIIARTMLEVFQDVILWRGDFFPNKPIVALVGAMDLEPLDPSALLSKGRVLAGNNKISEDALMANTLTFYAGNLGEARDLVPDGPINTDDRPLIEYLAPITHREQRAGTIDWFRSLALATFYRSLLEKITPSSDPYLVNFEAEKRDYVLAGRSYGESAVYRNLGQEVKADQLLRDSVEKLPVQFGPSTNDEDVYTEFIP